MKERKFVVFYMHNGAEQCVDIPARSFDEAEAKLSSLRFGKVMGELKLDLPVAAKPFVQVLCFVRNLLNPPLR